MKFVDWKTGRDISVSKSKSEQKLAKSVDAKTRTISALPDWDDDRRFSKSAGGEPAGTTHTWKDGKKYRKEPDGTWKEVSDAGKPAASKESGDKEGQKSSSSMSQKELKEALKNYSIVKEGGGVKLINHGINGGSWRNENGQWGDRKSALVFSDKDEAKQYVKDRIIPEISRAYAKPSTKQKDNAPDTKIEAQKNMANGFLSAIQKEFKTDFKSEIDKLDGISDLAQIKAILNRAESKLSDRSQASEFRKRANSLLNSKDFGRASQSYSEMTPN